MPEPDLMPDLLARLDAVRATASALEGIAPELELGDVAPLLHACESVYKSIGEATKALKAIAVAEMDSAHMARFRDPEGDLPPLLRTRPGRSPHWNGDEIGRRIAAKCADECVDPATGERLPLGVICERVAEAIVEAAGMTPSKSWRKQKLTGRWGIPIKEVFYDTPGEPSVRFDHEWRPPK